ncbi:hypothetical protein TYRP_017019 [Tyrophagus putrescentiae]|nr:hypothetical protein TYRP_017019 [Tyrophagus putrescentiae]
MEMQPTDKNGSNNGGGRKVKRCRVCSDEAIGFNFNGLSCGSCKSFFRRNITKYESFVCSRNNDCVITLYSRKCCTRCSYHQPVTTAGPVPLEMTQTPAAAAAAAALPYPEDFVNLLSTTESLPGLTSTSTSFQTPITPIQPHHPPTITPTITPITPITPLSIPPTTVDHPLGRADTGKKYELNFIELHYIAQIVRASAAAFKDEDSAPVVANATDVVYILNLAEYYIGKTIRFAKSLSAFLVLSQEDQLALLKAFFTELLILRLGFFYQAATDGYLALVDHIGSPVSRGGANSGGGSSNNHHSQAIFIRLSTLFGKANKLHQATLIRHFVISYQAVVDKDSTLRDLIITSLLFKSRLNAHHQPPPPSSSSSSSSSASASTFTSTSSSDNLEQGSTSTESTTTTTTTTSPNYLLSCPEYLRYQYYLHSRLLERYCEAKYRSSRRAREKLRSVEHLLSGIDQIKNIIEGLFIDTDESQISLVLNEIYRVK